MTVNRHGNAGLDHLVEQAERARPIPAIEEVGRVRRLESGVVLIEGLTEAFVDELVEFQNGTFAQVFDLDRTLARCVLLGPEQGIGAGSIAVRTGHALAIPVGPEVLGRVLDALGDPRDDAGPLHVDEERMIEQSAPGPLDRQPVSTPLFTGMKAIDATVPIGRGQRQLILGDRETGKTSLALDAIINQRESGVICVYVSIGAKRSSLAQVIDELRQVDALAYTTIVTADAEEPASLRYLAPYAGCAIAEWFAAAGRDALIVYDDLTRHAESYRELSLLLRRPPSREAYPGDIFSIHARLLERSFQLSDALGGGSVTALPIAETQRGNIASFIPTNLISMTDGQIYLSAELFTGGQLPAIDIGLSVSRVGRDAQLATMQDAGANLRLELAQYDDVKGFARFGAILDEDTKRQIGRGERLLQVLSQRERSPAPPALQVVLLWALRQGWLDGMATTEIPDFEKRLKDLLPRYVHLEQEVAAAPGITSELSLALLKWVTDAGGGPGGQS